MFTYKVYSRGIQDHLVHRINKGTATIIAQCSSEDEAQLVCDALAVLESGALAVTRKLAQAYGPHGTISDTLHREARQVIKKWAKHSITRIQP